MVEQIAVNDKVVGSNPTCGAIISNDESHLSWQQNASIAQQVEHFHGKEEVSGSSPLGSSQNIIIWPLGQAVKTPPFHGGNTGSNPVGVTKFILR